MSESARAAIRRLRTGVVPHWEFARLSVGYDQIKKIVEDTLSRIKQREVCRPLFVRGEWGTGKTHFLSYVRATAAESWCSSARIDLNARGVALSHPQRFLPLIADNLHAGSYVGIQDILPRLISIKAVRDRIEDFARTAGAADIGDPLRSLCKDFDAREGLGLGNHAAWATLRGADLCWSDHPSKREKALSRIDALARLCRRAGLCGLILILDEAETIDQLWNVRSRLSAYAVLGRLFQVESLWCVLGSTYRFDRAVEFDLSNDVLSADSISPDAVSFLQGWKEGQFETITPPELNGQDALELAQKVVGLYQQAYCHQTDHALTFMEQCVDEWMLNPVRNPRRLIRLLVHRLDLSRGLDAEIYLS